VGEERRISSEAGSYARGGISQSWAAATHHLQVLANAMMAFTPHISLAPDGIWMEIGRSAHLYGGEESTLHKALIQARSLGFRGCAVVADQPQTSRTLSRMLALSDIDSNISPFLVPRGGDARALSSLPISTLEPSDTALRLLEQLGLSEIGDLAKIPTSSLQSRLGTEGEQLLIFARAERSELPPRYVPVEQPAVELEFEPPLSGYEPMQFVFKRLLDDLVTVADGRGLSIDAFCLEIDFSGTPTMRVELPLARPSRSSESLLRVVREYLHGIDHRDSGILRVGFQILRMAQQAEEQNGLFERGAQIPARGAELLTRLEASLGEGAVYSASLRSTWCPEQSWDSEPFNMDELKSAARTQCEDEEERPIFLFGEPFELYGELKPGETLRWSEGCGVVDTIWGPERLRATWWSQPLVRDYYVVEMKDGARLWIYRDHENTRSYLHGLFD